jgi:hypothetical protein
MHARKLFRMLRDRQKKLSDYWSAARLPTAYLLPIVARTENSALPFERAASDKNTWLAVAEEDQKD